MKSVKITTSGKGSIIHCDDDITRGKVVDTLHKAKVSITHNKSNGRFGSMYVKMDKRTTTKLLKSF